MSETGNFLGYESAPLASALFSLIPAPFQGTATYVGGQAEGPKAILEASRQIEDYDEETGLNLVDEGIHCLDPQAARQSPDLESWVKARTTEALDAVAVPCLLGGEGTITLWGVQSLLARSDELSILHIDAHADLSDAGNHGENHHTVMRRILDLSPKPQICQVGVRSLSRDAFGRIVDDETPVECFFMSDLTRAEDESWHDDVIEELRSPVYVSVDLSCFDPSVVPAVSNPEPGGLTWWNVLRLLKKVASRRRIAGFDIVELCPRQGDINSDFTAARLAYKLMNYIYAGGKMLPKPEAGK